MTWIKKLSLHKAALEKEAVAKHTELQSSMRSLDFELSLLRRLVSDDVQDMSARIKDIEVTKTTCVGPRAGGKLHRVKIGAPAPPVRWRCVCPWFFAATDYVVVHNPDEWPNKCQRCFRKS